VASLALMVAGGFVTAAAHGFVVAAAGRLVSGAGAVLMNILLAKMVADWFTGRELSTAMGIMLTSWPVGLGIATATLGALATHASWRVAIVATALVAALGLVLIAFVYRDPPRAADHAAKAAERRVRLSGREIGLATSGGFAWGCFNASLVAIIAFGPGLLIARGVSLSDAGFVVSLAIWLTIVSVPIGGLITDRLGRPESPDRRGEPGRRLLHPAAAHAHPPDAGLLPGRPRDRRAARRLDGALTEGRGERAAGHDARRVLHDVLRRDGCRAARGRRRARRLRQPRRADRLRRARHGVDDRRLRGVPTRRSALTALTRPER
jgi:MFS family permease